MTHEQFLQKESKRLEHWKRAIPEGSKYGAAIVETRVVPFLDTIIKNHLSNLPKVFGLTIFHSSINESYLKEKFSGWNFINYVKLESDGMSILDYNHLLTGKWFWNNIPYEKVLIFQSDSLLLREGIEEFWEYDYVGSPWAWQNHGGNGGLSLRTKSIMMQINERQQYSTQLGNEDVAICNYMHQNSFGKLAPRDVCSKFACEAIFELGTFGVHACWKYLHNDDVKRILTQSKNETANRG